MPTAGTTSNNNREAGASHKVGMKTRRHLEAEANGRVGTSTHGHREAGARAKGGMTVHRHREPTAGGKAGAGAPGQREADVLVKDGIKGHGHRKEVAPAEEPVDEAVVASPGAGGAGEGGSNRKFSRRALGDPWGHFYEWCGPDILIAVSRSEQKK